MRAPSLLELDGTPLPFVTYDFQEKERAISQEVNLQSEASSEIQWIIGFFYFDDTARYDPIIQKGTAYGLGPDGGLVLYTSQTTRSYAGYAQATVPLFDDDTHLTGGVRYTVDEKSEKADRFLLGSNYHLGYTFPPGYPFSVREPKLTYRISLDHNFTQDVMGYASFSTGFKSGYYNLTHPTDLPVKPETLDAWEVGVKSELFNHRVRANVSAFYYRFNDKQVSSFVGLSTKLTNAAVAEYKGFDADFTVVLDQGLNFIGGLSYVDSNYVRYPGAVFVYPLAGGGRFRRLDGRCVWQPGAVCGTVHRLRYPAICNGTVVRHAYRAGHRQLPQ